jgi:hypothetical protein
MSKQLLIETYPITISSSLLTENVGGVGKPLIVEGILATAEIKNGNGRITVDTMPENYGKEK